MLCKKQAKTATAAECCVSNTIVVSGETLETIETLETFETFETLETLEMTLMLLGGCAYSIEKDQTAKIKLESVDLLK